MEFLSRMSRLDSRKIAAVGHKSVLKSDVSKFKAVMFARRANRQTI